MPTRRTGGIPRSPPETRAKIEEEETTEAGPSMEIPLSPFSAIGIKKEKKATFSLFDEQGRMRMPEELKPQTKKEE